MLDTWKVLEYYEDTGTQNRPVSTNDDVEVWWHAHDPLRDAFEIFRALGIPEADLKQIALVNMKLYAIGAFTYSRRKRHSCVLVVVNTEKDGEVEYFKDDLFTNVETLELMRIARSTQDSSCS